MSKKRKWYETEDVILTIELLDENGRTLVEMPPRKVPEGGTLTVADIEVKTGIDFEGGKGWIHGVLRIRVERS